MRRASGMAVLCLGLFASGCVRTHTLSVRSRELLPKLVDIYDYGKATVPVRDEITEGPTDDNRGLITKAELKGSDVLPLPRPAGPIRLDVLAKRCLHPDNEVPGEDPCYLRAHRDDVYVIGTREDRAVRPAVYGTLAIGTLGGLLFGATCLSGVCDGAPDVKGASEFVGATSAAIAVAWMTWALFDCITGPPGTCRD